MKSIRPNNLPTHFSLFSLLFMACLAMALVLVPGGQPTLARQAVEQEGRVPQVPQVPAGTGFTYQGQLKSGGSPANGQYDFTFTLYDALAGGNQVGAAVNLTGQMVAEGLFTVQLDFGANVFQGQARWLEIAVRVAGGGTYTTLSPRQPLTAAPYAQSLMPGAVISGTLLYAPTLTITNTNTGGIGVKGMGTGTLGIGVLGTGSEFGVRGESATGTGVLGYSNSSSESGVRGYNDNNGPGVAGQTTGNGPGVTGQSNNIGVYGYSPSNTGVWGQSNGFGDGVYGYSVWGMGVRAVSGDGEGVDAVGGTYGVHGLGSDAGVFGEGTSANSNGVVGSTTDAGFGYAGVYGVSGGSNGTGVFGHATASNATGVYGLANGGAGATGVRGDSTDGKGVYGESINNDGVFGVSSAGYGFAGVYGIDLGSNGAGVYGYADGGLNAVGVRGASSQGYAGYFDGRVHVNGTLSKAAGSFMIDDPIDPQNKYLYHSFVESPDMMNIYNGNVTTDATGQTVVTMPDWFEALNMDFRYQLTIMGDQFAQARVSSKIKNNHFTIMTDKPNIEVSWQVTGIRHDPYADKNRIPVEEDKAVGDKGKYLYPQGYGQPESRKINFSPQPQPQTQAPANPQAPAPVPIRPQVPKP